MSCKRWYRSLQQFCSLLIFACLSSLCWGQYTQTTIYGDVDVLNSTYSPYTGYNCASDNCWVQTEGGNFKSLAAASDGTVIAVGASYSKVYQWKYSSSSFVEQTDMEMSGKTLSQIRAESSTELVALTTESTYNYYTWNGSSWSSYPIWCSDVGISSAGDIWCVGHTVNGSNINHWNGSGFTLVSGVLTNIAVSITAVGGIGTDGNLWLWDSTCNSGSGCFTKQSLPFAPSSNVEQLPLQMMPPP